MACADRRRARGIHRHVGQLTAPGVGAAQALSPEQLRRVHEEPFARARTLLERARQRGEFRDDVSIDWQLRVVQAILHGASAAVHRGEITAEEAPGLVRDTVMAALAR